ncbi:hypothetical protein B0J13DRAFT_44449 [Dactylonectria estremocensis]|uniref:Rhodopsin domain-containing protein n=1 Tax=Dactylonectria estremocensis TaxID=1079267 RepID=A0A9P9ETP3_9HYPO|nr:hypothetical protein B0J13DRAFT_44449 [Dactylonectria estremocensis]
MSSFTTEAFTLLGIGLGILGLRVFARIHAVGVRRLELDDYFMFLAAFLYSAETALAYSVGAYWHGLANNAMTAAERELLDPTSQEYVLRVNGSKTQIAGWTVYITLLWTLKAAMCAFYLRLTEGLENYRSRIFAGFGLIFATWVVVLLSILLGCRPLHKSWQINPDPGNVCQPAISKINLFVTVVLNGLTDIFILSIPLPMLWSARLPLPKKLGLVALFSGGIFVFTAGTLRCVLILRNPVKGAEQAGYWAVRETFVAVVTSNLPVVFPFIRRQLSPILGSLPSTGRSGDLTTKRGANPMPGSIRLDDIPTGNASTASNGAFRKKGASISGYPIGSDNDSDETIHMGGIRKETDVRIVTEGRAASSATPNAERDLARALYGQPGVKGSTEVKPGTLS